MGMIQDGLRKLPMATGTRAGEEGHGGCRVQQHLRMASMTRLASRLASLGSVRPSLTFFCGGISRRRPTGIGGVPVETGFEGLDPLEEAEELLLHTRRSLLPIFSR